jgi:signal transduction histidine kinase
MNRLNPVKYTLIIVLFCAMCNTVVAQTTVNTVSNTPAAAEIENYTRLITRYRYDKPDSALFFTSKGLAYAKSHHDKQGEAIMLNQLGMINDNSGKYEAAHHNYIEALNLYQSIGQDKGMATERIRLGVVEMRQGNYDKAIGYFLQALKTSERIHEPKGTMEAYITLGEAYMGQKKYPQALKYLQTAEAIDKTIPFSNLSLNLRNDFGITYTVTGEFSEAKAYLNDGISKSNTPQYQGLNITLINNLAALYARQGNTDYCIWLQKAALRKAQYIHNFLREEQTLNGLAKTYRTINADSSLSYLFKVKALAQSKNAHKQVIEALQNIGEIYTQKGKYQAAFKVRNEQYALADQYFYKEMAKQITSLQADYELTKSKAKVQELQFANGRQQLEHRIITSIALGVIVILLVLAWYHHRTRGLNKLLRKLNRKLDESNHIKDKLFSIMGHDLRTPFISVINLLNFIDDEDLPADSRKELINELNATTQASLETLDSLLRWGEMQIKGIRLNQTEFLIKPVADRILALLHEAAGYKSIEVINDIGPEVKVYADVNHIEFVLRNMVANAIKFTGTGGHIQLKAQANIINRSMQLQVEDNGVGIAAEKLPHIFNLHNVSSNGTYNEKGTSLGLMMCNEFIQANSGTITVDSELGKGSVFTVELPVASDALLHKRRKFRLKLFRHQSFYQG